MSGPTIEGGSSGLPASVLSLAASTSPRWLASYAAAGSGLGATGDETTTSSDTCASRWEGSDNFFATSLSSNDLGAATHIVTSDKTTRIAPMVERR